MEYQPKIERSESEVRRALIIEHAQLVSALAAENSEEYRERLAEIEAVLSLSPSEIAVIALQYYKEGYRG